ncbi:MAG: hypothetical protein ACK5JD_15640 [Mangrovibacterium sp.]
MQNTMHRNPGNWQGPFDINLKDPPVLVPKYYLTMGLAFNFGNTYAGAVIASFIPIPGIHYFLNC